MTGIARLWRNWAGYYHFAAWDGVITLAVAVVCDRVLLAIGPRPVGFSTLRGGGSTVCRTLDLLCHDTGS